MKEPVTGHAAIAPALLLFLLVAGATLAARGVLVHVYLHDFWLVLDALWRGALGEIPARDFHSPVGPAFFWPLALLGAAGDLSALALLHANLLVGGIIVALALAVLPSRLEAWRCFAGLAVIMLAAITPRDPGHGPLGLDFTVYSHLAPYNRWSWSLLTLVALTALLPRARRSVQGEVIDGVVLALALSLLYYLKVSVFAGAILLCLVGLAARSIRWRELAVSIFSAGSVVVLVELLQGNNFAYLTDIRMASAAVAGSGDVFRPTALAYHMAEAGVFGLAILLALGLKTSATDIRSLALALWRPLLTAAAVLVVFAMVAMQNHGLFAQAPLLSAAAIIAFELARPAKPPPRASARYAGLALAGLATAYVPILDAGAIVGHSVGTYGSGACKAAALADTMAADVRLPPAAFASDSSPARVTTSGCATRASYPLHPREAARLGFEVALVREARALIASTRLPRPRVLTLDFTNPYPALLRLPPPEGALAWWHYGRTFAQHNRPDPVRLLNGVDLVLQRRHDRIDDTTGSRLWRVYGSSVKDCFVPAMEGSEWRLWSRKRDGLSPSCGMAPSDLPRP